MRFERAVRAGAAGDPGLLEVAPVRLRPWGFGATIFA